MGRPVRYGGEMGGVRERTAYMAGIAEAALAPQMIEDSDRFRRVLAREPLGLVLVIAPWNYPFLTAINTIVPALIAGNAVALKHASQTPLAGERLAQAFAHLPEGLFTNLFLDHDTTAALIARAGLRLRQLHRQREGGREIERAAAGTFVGLGLELGGKDPGYVRADAEPRRGGRHADGRGDVQRRPVLLRHRAHLRARKPLRGRSWRSRSPGSRSSGSATRSTQETTLGPMATPALRRRRARADRRGGGGGRDAAGRPAALPGRHRRQRLPRAADPRGRRPLDAGDDRGELRPGGRHHAGQGRRGGDRADERQPLRADRQRLDRGRRRRPRRSGRASRPAPSS